MLDRDTFEDVFVIHEFGGTTYYNKERFEFGVAAAFCLDLMDLEDGAQDETEKETARALASLHDRFRRLGRAHAESDFNWDNLTSRFGGSASRKNLRKK